MSTGVLSWESSLWHLSQAGTCAFYLLHNIMSSAPYIQYVRPGGEKKPLKPVKEKCETWQYLEEKV